MAMLSRGGFMIQMDAPKPEAAHHEGGDTIA